MRYRWTGREFDLETGWYFFRARYYDPVAMRFVQEDPIGFAGGTNVYAYGNGNPTDGRDPDGLRKDYDAMASLGGYRPVNDGPFECWTSHCGGGGGGGGFWDWMDDHNAQIDRIWQAIDAYNAYLGGYAATRNALVAGYAAANQPQMAQALAEHSSPLGFEQFRRREKQSGFYQRSECPGVR